MNCPKCSSYNEDGNGFCINCGESFQVPNAPPPTQFVAGYYGGTSGSLSNPSQPTVIHAQIPTVQPNQPANIDPSFAAFQQSFPIIPPAQAEAKSRVGLFIGIGALALLLLAGAVVAVVVFVDFKPKPKETLPASLGLFFQNADKTAVTEIKKQDFADASAARDKFAKDDSLPVLDPRPNVVLYSDGKDVPVSDLKLVEVDSIKDDGTLKHVEFKAATVEGKLEMKRIWVTEDLAAGKYAFALFDGYFEDGKHHFWPFEVTGGSSEDNGDLAKSETIARKAKSTTTPKTENTPVPEKKVVPPPDTSVAYCQSSNVVLRSGPSQLSGKIGSLKMSQKLYVIEYSDRYETFVTRDGRQLNSNYAYVQTESGKRGWVYAAFIK